MKFCTNHNTRRVFSKGLCVECYKQKYSKPLRRTPLKKKPYVIKPIADKRRKQLQDYTPLKNTFLEEHPLCEIKGLNCLILSSEVHHTEGKENELLLDVSKFKATCHNCHVEITENSKQAIQDGHSKSRHSNNKINNSF